MEEKTNVMRVLDQKKIKYHSHHLDITEALSGVEMAAMLNQDPARVFKTLVTVGKTKVNYVFVIPVAEELDLKKAAKVAGDKDMVLIPVKDLLGITGYIRGGCSPVGMKKSYPTYFEESCELFNEIAVSAGERGHQMILSPLELVHLINGTLADIIV